MDDLISKQLYDKVLNLANDPKEHFNLGMHKTNNKYGLALMTSFTKYH